MNLAYLEIDYCRASYDSLRGAQREQFLQLWLFSWLYHEHALEGVVLTQEDITRALDGRPCRNYCDRQTAKSLRRMHSIMRETIEAAAARQLTIDMEWLKSTHAALCDATDEAAGRYRKRDTSPGVYNLDVVPASSISYYFHKLMDTLDQELAGAHPVRAAAIAHWEFMRVFPFDERTGLVGRLMLNAILLNGGYPPAIFHAHDRHLYFNAIGGHRTDLVPVVVDAVSATIKAADQFSRQHIAPPARKVAY